MSKHLVYYLNCRTKITNKIVVNYIYYNILNDNIHPVQSAIIQYEAFPRRMNHVLGFLRMSPNLATSVYSIDKLASGHQYLIRERPRDYKASKQYG